MPSLPCLCRISPPSLATSSFAIQLPGSPSHLNGILVKLDSKQDGAWMNRFTRYAIIATSVVIISWVGFGKVLGRSANDKAYKSLVVYSEVLQKIQQDYVDEP